MVLIDPESKQIAEEMAKATARRASELYPFIDAFRKRGIPRQEYEPTLRALCRLAPERTLEETLDLAFAEPEKS